MLQTLKLNLLPCSVLIQPVNGHAALVVAEVAALALLVGEMRPRDLKSTKLTGTLPTKNSWPSKESI